MAVTAEHAGAVTYQRWLEAARAAATLPPVEPRLPLWVAGHEVGSVAGDLLNENGLHSFLGKRYKLSKVERFGAQAWHLDVAVHDATLALNALAAALREHDRCGPWRNEQLRVLTADGTQIGTVERGAVRVLGLQTRAVHLVGQLPDGRMWVQKRSSTKPNNPGMWDTLMGGMVAAQDSLPEALARETWEEAGLRVEALEFLNHGGHVDFARPSREGGGRGYMRERIDWFHAVVPEGLEPVNQDGEVERFEAWTALQVREALLQGQFTQEAGLVIAGAWSAGAGSGM